MNDQQQFKFAQDEAVRQFDKLLADVRQQAVQAIGDQIVAILVGAGYRPDAVKASKPSADFAVKIPKAARKAVTFKIRPNTDVERVYNEVKAHPGNRGHQLAALLAMKGVVVHDRTLRTALRRLKLRGFIIQRNEAWFPKEEKNSAAES